MKFVAMVAKPGDPPYLSRLLRELVYTLWKSPWMSLN